MSTGLRVGLYNAAAVLLALLLAAVFSEGKGTSSSHAFFVIGRVLTFPAWLLRIQTTTATGGREIVFWFLSPLFWGAAGYMIHRLVRRRA